MHRTNDRRGSTSRGLTAQLRWPKLLDISHIHVFYEGNKTQGWVRVAAESYKLVQMFMETHLSFVFPSNQQMKPLKFMVL